MFVDYLTLHVQGGNGGPGATTFRREKYVPRGGPDGGDGGRGGSVLLEADPKLGTLLDLKFHQNLVAKNGGPGTRQNCHGADGPDIVVRVPLGTVVSDEDGVQVADLSEPGERWVAAAGGRGGLGNTHFATATNKTPHYAQPGEEGQERRLVLELKLIADAGFVGLPNAGKSTLLSKLTSATPKIAPYPFTTLSPNLGVMEFEDLTHLTLADIPGLIEGASHGVGLGDRFLRHIERTLVLVHLVGDETGEFDPETMLYKYDLVNAELAAYGPALAAKPQIVLISKIDLANLDDIEKTCEAFRARGIEPMRISAQTGEGLEALRERLRAAVAEEKTRRAASDAALAAAAAEGSKGLPIMAKKRDEKFEDKEVEDKESDEEDEEFDDEDDLDDDEDDEDEFDDEEDEEDDDDLDDEDDEDE
jgi:GTP-binding protein